MKDFLKVDKMVEKLVVMLAFSWAVLMDDIMAVLLVVY